MDKFSKKIEGINVLVIKNSVVIYKLFLFVPMLLSVIILVLGVVFHREFHFIIVNCFISLVLFLAWLSCERLVNLFRLPSNRIIVDDEKLRFIHRTKIIEFNLSDITFEFHSFFEDFESLPTLIIKSQSQHISIIMEKKQFSRLQKYLDKNK